MNFSGHNFIWHAIGYPVSNNYSKVIFDFDGVFPLKKKKNTRDSGAVSTEATLLKEKTKTVHSGVIVVRQNSDLADDFLSLV